MIKFKRILFPTDFSQAASYALDYAISLALEHEATLCLVHVIEATDFNSAFVLSYFPRTVEYEDPLKGQAKKNLEEAVSPQVKRQINVEEVIAQGKPYQEIIRVAKEKDVDLIVIPTNKALEHRHLHLGSTAERVVSLSPCPVLVIRHPALEASKSEAGSLATETRAH